MMGKSKKNKSGWGTKSSTVQCACGAQMPKENWDNHRAKCSMHR